VWFESEGAGQPRDRRSRCTRTVRGGALAELFFRELLTERTRLRCLYCRCRTPLDSGESIVAHQSSPLENWLLPAPHEDVAVVVVVVRAPHPHPRRPSPRLARALESSTRDGSSVARRVEAKPMWAVLRLARRVRSQRTNGTCCRIVSTVRRVPWCLLSARQPLDPGLPCPRTVSSTAGPPRDAPRDGTKDDRVGGFPSTVTCRQCGPIPIRRVSGKASKGRLQRT
jgi:hypothetical protein